MWRKKLSQVALLLLVLSMVGSLVTARGEAKNRGYETDAAGMTMQLCRKKPVEGILWINVREGVFSAYSVETNPAALLGIPPDRICGAFTAYPEVLAKAKRVLERGDRLRALDCRFVHVESKPSLALIIKRANGSILHFNLVSLTDDAWQERVNDYLIAEKLSRGELMFAWRLVYQLTMLRATPSNPVHRDMDYIDGDIGTRDFLFSSGQHEHNTYSVHSSSTDYGMDEYSSADDHILEKVTSKISFLRGNLQVDPADWPEITSADDIVEILRKC